MTRILNFLNRKYLKRANSHDPILKTAWTAAFEFRNDANLASHREYLINKYRIPEEQLDSRFGAEKIHSIINPNWGETVDLNIKIAEQLGIADDVISLAKRNINAAILLKIHLKILDEIEKFGRPTDILNTIRKLDAEEKEVSDAAPNQNNYDLTELIQLSRIDRQKFYSERKVNAQARFTVEFMLMAISENGDFFEELKSEYKLLCDNIEEDSIDATTNNKISVLQATVEVFDNVKSSGMHVNIMCLCYLLYMEHQNEVLDFVISNTLSRARYISRKYNDEFYLEKYLLHHAAEGDYWNNGAIFGSVLKVADRRLINQAYKYMSALDQSGVAHSLYYFEATTSAPVIDFLVDWATHFQSLGMQEATNSILNSLYRISARLIDGDLIDGTFRVSDLWEVESDQITSQFTVPFATYLEKHKAKIDRLLGS